ncbi:hypothetical protein ACP6PL_25680 [Dapis sp. BLCC M126]|uniref:hypothetical protein n=1 Tax=Dapis sp. BLCC M126 TaxID=3400189 RepID=UPI003CEE3B84
MLLSISLADQRDILWGQVKVPLHSWLRFKPSFGVYFCDNIYSLIKVCIERAIITTYIQTMLLDAVAHGGNPQDRAASLYSFS